MENDSPDATDGIENTLTAEATETAAPEQDASPAPELPDTDAANSTEPSQVEPQKEPTRAEKRIQQLVGEKKAAMEYGEFYRQKFEESQTGSTQEPQPEPAAPSMPLLADFDYDQDAWGVAMAQYNAQMVEKTVSERVVQALQQRDQTFSEEQANTAWKERASAFAAEHDDFEEVALNPAVPISQEMGEVIRTSEKGPDLAYHLGQNPAEAYRISQMPPTMQAFELAKVELSLASPSTPAVAQKPTTQAPEPMNPVGGQQPNVPIGKETIEDFMARRNREQFEARKH